MKNPLNRDDFENYLEHEVNQHRMYPSDQIWRNIQQDIHGYKKWPALTVITLFVISALVVGTVLIKPQYQKLAALSAAQSQKTAAAVNTQPQENLQEHLSPENITRQTIAGVTQSVDLNDDDIQTAFSAYNNVYELMPAINAEYAADNAVAANAPAAEQKSTVKKEVAVNINTGKRDNIANWMRIAPDDNMVIEGQLSRPATPIAKATFNSGNFMFFSLDNQPSSSFNGVSLENSFSKANRPAFKFKPKGRKFDFAFYATPSLSYRKLVFDVPGNNGHTYVSGIPYGANYTVDLNKSIVHKPAVGYEVGAALGYKLSKTLTLRTGFQFNMREYDIEAYKHEYTPTDIIAYNNAVSGIDVSNQRAASIAGEESVILRNRYYEISMPIGIDWRAWHSGKFSMGFATAVQPTYIFDKDPFIITSDYKNYADGSRLVRNWNINTNIETYVSYTTGKFKWQLGPQFRYQVLSTLSGAYPIKEHLIDYGIKLGFVKSLP